MGRDPVQVVQAPLPQRHPGMLVSGDDRGRDEVPAGQPPPGPSLQGLAVRHRPRQECRGPGSMAAGSRAGIRVPAVTPRPHREAPAGWWSVAGRRASRAGRADPGRPARGGGGARRRSRHGPGTPAPASAGEPLSPRRPLRGPPAVPVPGRLVALGGLAGTALFLLLPHLGRPLRNGGDPAEEPQQHGQQVIIGFRRQPGGTGLAEQLVRGLVGERGDLSLGRQPVPAQGVPFPRVRGVPEEHLPPVAAVIADHARVLVPSAPARRLSLIRLQRRVRPAIPEPADLYPAVGVDLHVTDGAEARNTAPAGGPAGRTRPGDRGGEQRVRAVLLARTPGRGVFSQPRCLPDRNNPLCYQMLHLRHGQRCVGLGSAPRSATSIPV